MTYPGNYGFVPHTLSEDGDPIDVLICNTRPLAPACVINARPIGVLVMEDNAGQDEKILAVPSHKLTKRYDKIHSYSDLPPITLQQIEHFFEHYKDLEPGKWVKLGNWRGPEDAQALIVAAIERNLDINGSLPSRRDSDPNTDGSKDTSCDPDPAEKLLSAGEKFG